MSIVTQETYEVDQLRWIKLKIPRLIPPHLIENVKGSTFSPKSFYEYQEQVRDFPGNLLYVLADQDNVIQGFLWGEINNLDGSLFVNTFSITKEYWHKGKILDKVTVFLKELRKIHSAPKVYWMTTNAKFFEKHGFNRSKNVLMEYNPDKQESNHGSE